LLKLQKIVAGTDSGCRRRVLRDPAQPQAEPGVMLAKTAAAGVGRADFEKLSVREIAI